MKGLMAAIGAKALLTKVAAVARHSEARSRKARYSPSTREEDEEEGQRRGG